MEEKTPPPFMKISAEVATHFLHTVVFLDDQAAFEEAGQQKELKTPGRKGKQEDETPNPDSQDKIHKLDAKKVMDVFASEGMVCSVLKPDKTEDPLGITIKAAKRADVLVLDWQLCNDDGNKSMEIIEDVIDSDSKEDHRLRLIIIYTGDEKLAKITEDIKK